MITFLIAIAITLVASLVSPTLSDAVCSTPRCPIATRPATLAAAADFADFDGWAFA